MNEIEISSITGVTMPFSAYTCDVYGNNCVYVGSGSTLPIIFTLPLQFNTAPALQLTVIDSNGCSFYKIINC